MASVAIRKKDGGALSLDNITAIKVTTSSRKNFTYTPDQWDNITLGDCSLAFVGDKQNIYIDSSEISHVTLNKG